MTNLSDQIISVFLNKQELILKDSDISLSLIAQGIQCYTEEIRRRIQSLSPGLFQISFHKDSSLTIQVEPKIDICGLFLTGRCHNTVKPCGKLHICREFGHCTIPNCRYPHDFSRGENRKILEQMNCQDINSRLLVQLIRLKKPVTQSESFSRPRKSLPTTISRQESLRKIIEDDIDKQIDISYPSLDRAPQIDMEIIEMMLNTEGLRIEKKLNECQNEFFRRATVQLDQIKDIEQLYNSSKFSQENFDIKFKRTKQFIDQSSFLLKISMNNLQDTVTERRVQLYTSLLVGPNVSFKINDFSTSDEQIFLIQCDSVIDFDKVRQLYEMKPQLQNRDVMIIQIYECDAVAIHYIDENKSIKYDDIENFVPNARKNVFTFEITNRNCVEIEFINVNAYQQWMLNVEKIKAKFNVMVFPVTNHVENNETLSPSLAQNIPFNLHSASSIDKPQATKIKLRQEWALVAAHRIFKQEYKDYIHEQLGGTIEINDDEVTYTGDFPRLPRCPTNESILSNKTNNYMQKLKYQTLHDLKRHHVNILHAHSSTIAFIRSRRNDYLVAGKPQDFFELKTKLFPKINQDKPNPLLPQEIPPLLPPPPLTSMFPITTTEQMSMFKLNRFEERLQEYLKQTFNVKVLIERTLINDKIKGEKSRIIIKISGQTNDVENGLDDLMNLFSSLRTRKFDDKTDGNWTKIEEAIEIIQHHFIINDFICTCEKISSTSVHVNYFDLINPQFGIDEQKIEDLINNQFSLATITYIQQSNSSKFMNEWMNLEEIIRTRDDYKKDICLYNELNTIYLFGLTKLVKEFRQIFEQLKNKYIPQICKINLSDKQLNYLADVAKNDLNKLEKQYKTDGCEVNLIRLRQQRDFLAPLDMHSKIKDSIEALAQIVEETFEIENTAFGVLINNDPECLQSIIKSKCSMEKDVQTRKIYIPVPTAQVDDLEDLAQQPPPSPAASATNVSSINIGQSTITIAIGDLTTQAVDMIVVCSTSEILRNKIITIAGPQVQAEFDAMKGAGQHTYGTSHGTLPCKRILFVPWKSDSSDPTSLQPSLSKFVSTAIAYAIKKGYTTIAFPSIGCGKLGFDPLIIAKHMLDETHIQLKGLNTKLTVSYILLPNPQNVYDEFIKYLNSIKTSTSPTSPKPKTNNRFKIAYEEKIIKITLISANNNHLIKCKNDINELAHSSSFKKRLTNKDDMIDWPQKTINQYYAYCLYRHVIPTLDLNTRTLELVGPKDAVHEAEKYFYQSTTETFKQARIHAVSQGIIWSVEITPDSNAYEQYSYKLNGTIEDAYLKKLPQIDFINDKQEKCRVVFNSMEEQHGTDIRRIRRKVVNSLLPDEWGSSDQSCTRIPLQTSSKEYQDILKQFDNTMKGNYRQIVKIERIQNERWYKQYAAHRDEYKQRYGKLDERLLFHGCLGTSANQIIQECFNRSFAGVNGIAFGCGVYFHSNAIYSHSYAKVDVSGERTMFLARVLIGKTCQGNPSMKVPPHGYDTTSDGRDIFVIYHDAGAYADHLITYK